MKYEEGDIIKLQDDKEYVILGTVPVNKETYLYLITTNEPLEMELVKLTKINDKESVTNVTDIEEKKYVTSLFINRMV